jgi:hypothetical protein
VTPRRLVSALLDAVDDVNPRQYLADVPKRLLLEIRGALEKLGWQFMQMSKPNEAYFKKLADRERQKCLLWVYVWQAKLHAYGTVGFLPQGEYEVTRHTAVEEIEQEPGMAPEQFAQWIDAKYTTLEGPDADEDFESPDMVEALDPDELPPKEFLKKLPERLMVQLVVDEEASPEGIPPATVDARDYFASRTSAFIARVHRFCKQTNENRAGIAFESDEPASVEALRNMPGAEYIVEYIQRWGTTATMYVSKEALEAWILRERPKLAKRLRLTVAEALDPDEIKPKEYTKGMTPRDLKIQGRLVLVGPNPEDAGNPVVECPVCHFRGHLMDDFSYLAAGFNGIEVGEEDDLDLQECGNCAAKLEWSHIPGVVEALDPDQPPAAKELFRQLPQSFESWLRAHGFEGREDKEFVADPELPVIQGQTTAYTYFERNTDDFVYTARKQDENLWTVSVADWREGEDNIKGTQKFDLPELEAKKLIMSWIRRHG